MDIRFIALNGSERARGTTARCLDLARAYLETRSCDIEIIHLAEQEIRQCSCGRCNSRPDPCPVDDDTGEIVARMKAADAIVYAAPVHGFGLAGVMQRFIERAGVGFLRFDRPLTNRVGGIVVVGRRYSHENAYTQLMNNLMLNRMIMAGSGFPALLRAGGPQDLGDDVEGLDSMYRMLDRMVEMCLMLRDASRPLTVPSTVEHRTGTLS